MLLQVRTPPPTAHLIHAKTPEQHFIFLRFFAGLMALNYIFSESIFVDFRRDLDLEFSRSNMEFAVYQSTMVPLPRNGKQTYRLRSRPQM